MKKILFLFLGLCLIDAHFIVGMQRIIPYKDFFSHIVGMTEDEFRQEYQWDTTNCKLKVFNSLASFDDWKKTWIEEHALRKYIFKGDVEVLSLHDINNKVDNQQSPHQPSFNLIFTDQQKTLKTDITNMQTSSLYKNNTFQLASTFYGLLEGGMILGTEKITKMLEWAVQGEWASISAAAATIFRKYFRPTINQLNNHPAYPLLNDVYESNGHQDYKDFKLGIHKNVNALFRSNGLFCKDPNGLLRESKRKQEINQVFTATVDLRQKNVTSFDKKYAQDALNAAYEGTVKLAYLSGNNTCVLTLIGGGAFQNKMEWIASALERPEFVDFIKQKGMKVQLVFRADKKRHYAQVRDAAADKLFLTRMFGVMDRINGTNLLNNQNLDSLLNIYLNAWYENIKINSKVINLLNNPQKTRNITALPVVNDKLQLIYTENNVAKNITITKKSDLKARNQSLAKLLTIASNQTSIVPYMAGFCAVIAVLGYGLKKYFYNDSKKVKKEENSNVSNNQENNDFSTNNEQDGNEDASEEIEKNANEKKPEIALS